MLKECIQLSEMKSVLHGLLKFLSAQDNKGDIKTPIWFSPSCFFFTGNGIHVWSFFSPPMEALDSVTLTRRDKDHKNHLDRQSQKKSASFS